LSKVPVATFSTCFGEPFLPLKPNIYSDLLKEKISAHNAQVWLINTGWTAGDYNTGHRMPLPYTRRMVNWILSDEHRKADFHPDPVFKILVPNEIDGIPSELLTPEKTWEDKETFNRIAKQLMIDFEKNFGKFKAFL
jgi:phosphoenolpyruvate carboxykinase (ATP)